MRVAAELRHETPLLLVDGRSTRLPGTTRMLTLSSRLWRFWLGCPGRWGGARSLWADDAVVEVLPGGTSQGGEDAFGVVVRTLDVQGLAVVAELDRARAGPGTEVPGGGLEARGGLEAETSGVVDGAEHQVLGQVQRCRQG